MSKRSDDRIEKLRNDPDFKALVKLLREQDPERVELLVEQMEEPESSEEGTIDNGGEKAC